MPFNARTTTEKAGEARASEVANDDIYFLAARLRSKLCKHRVGCLDTRNR